MVGQTNSYDFVYIENQFGFTKPEILSWIDDLRVNHSYWYNRLIHEGFIPTFDHHFKEVDKIKNEIIFSQLPIVNRFGWRLDFILEEVYQSIKYITCATQMEIDKKRGTNFFETPNIGLVLTTNKIFVFDTENNKHCTYGLK